MNVWVVYLIVCIILSIGVILSKGVNVFAKGALILSLIFGSILSFNLLDEYVGEPKIITSMVDDFIVYGFVPDKDNGRIYMLYTPTHDKTVWPPVYVSIPYSVEVHTVLNAGREIHEGKPFRMKVKPLGEGEGEEGKEGSSNKEDRAGEWNLSLSSPTDIDISGLPQPKLPIKDRE